MNLNHHCVPTWNNLEDVNHHPNPPPPPPPPLSSRTQTHPSHSLSASLSAGPETSMLDYEMAELTWENGQLTMHGLGPRVPSKSNLADATRANGMLESIVNQAYSHPSGKTPTPGGGCVNHDDEDVVPWYGPTSSAPVPVTLDALVPNNNVMGCSTRVGSCSAAARVPMGSDWSVSVSASKNARRKRQAEDTCEQLRSMNNNNGLTSTSFGASPENTKTFTLDDHDHDSASQSRSQKERGEEEENQKQGTAKSTGSTKRSRAAAVHNQSERKRRDKINQRMKTLQKLVPNSNKTDKASMLDEVIEHLKNLQAQVQMLSRMSLPSMMMPLAIQHQLQMSMMTPIGLGMGMGVGMDQLNNMNMNPMGRPNLAAGVSPSLINLAAAYSMPLATSCDNNTTSTTNAGAYNNIPRGALVSADPLSTYLACQQSHPMTMDAYSKMAAMYQQQLQQQTQQQQQQLKQNHQQQPGRPS